eukprot:g64821.t1
MSQEGKLSVTSMDKKTRLNFDRAMLPGESLYTSGELRDSSGTSLMGFRGLAVREPSASAYTWRGNMYNCCQRGVQDFAKGTSERVGTRGSPN